MNFYPHLLQRFILLNIFYFFISLILYANQNIKYRKNIIKQKFIYHKISKTHIKYLYNIKNILTKNIIYENKKIFKDNILKQKKNYNKFLFITNKQNHDLTLTIDFANHKGKLPWPVKNGIILNDFGIQNYPGLNGIYIDNSGIDILVKKNNQAKAIFKGVVNYIYSIYGSMKAVLIKHGNYYTLYSNLKDLLVKQGNQVKINQYIGKIYTSPKGETLLNFQIWHNTSKENPSDWIKNL